MKLQLNQILLVDDNDIDNYLSMQIINKMKVAKEVVVAQDGEEALEYIVSHRNEEYEKHNPMLVLLDVNMPIMDGFEFLIEFQRLKQKENIKVVMLSSSDDRRDVEKAFQLQASSYLIKPLTEEKLNHILEQLYKSNQCMDNN